MNEINCNNCDAACCRLPNTVIKLTGEERDFLEQAGTPLKELLPADPDTDWSSRKTRKTIGSQLLKSAARELKPGEGIYLREGACGFVTEDGACSVYDSEQRPNACKTFTAGGALCREMRNRQQGPVDVTIRRYSA